MNKFLKSVIRDTTSTLCAQVASKLCKNIYEFCSNIMVFHSGTFNYSMFIDYIKDKFPEFFDKYGYVRNKYSKIYDGKYKLNFDRFNFMILESSTTVNFDGTKCDSLRINVFGKDSYKYYSSIVKYMNDKAKNECKIHSLVGESIKIAEIPNKTFDDVFFYGKDRLIDFLDYFMNDKSYYEKHNMNHKVGILLYGKPGTGKSTIIKALANYIGYNIISINADDIQYVTQFNVDLEKSIIVLEDIDCYIGKRTECTSEDTNEMNSVIGTVLNVLDGISSNGTIFVATTNHIENLDDALVRSGRFDFKLEVDYIGRDLAEEMCIKLEADPEVILANVEFPTCPADIQKLIIEERSYANKKKRE